MSMVPHPADSHAPFAHYLITTPIETVKMKGAGGAKGIETVTGGTQFIVCAFCRHWISRPMYRTCNCPASCHAQVRGIDALIRLLYPLVPPSP